MSLFEQFATDTNKENDGVKIEYPANKDGSIPSITVRRTGRANKRYSKALNTATKPHRRQIDLGTFDDEASEKLFKKVFVDTIVVTWENIQDEKDKEIPFSKENVMALFDKLPDFYEDVQRRSGDISLFRNEVMESDAKN